MTKRSRRLGTEALMMQREPRVIAYRTWREWLQYLDFRDYTVVHSYAECWATVCVVCTVYAEHFTFHNYSTHIHIHLKSVGNVMGPQIKTCDNIYNHLQKYSWIVMLALSFSSVSICNQTRTRVNCSLEKSYEMNLLRAANESSSLPWNIYILRQSWLWRFDCHHTMHWNKTSDLQNRGSSDMKPFCS